MTTLAVADLTQATLEGLGVFDVLMRANKAHLEAEFSKNRIKGPEYSQVYLGSLTQVMQTSLQFLLAKEATALQADLLAQQILLAQIEVQKATASLEQIQAQTALVVQQKLNAQAELAILEANALKIPAEIAHIEAQTLLATQQKANLIVEALNIPKQGEVLDANKAQITQQTANLVSQKAQIDAQTALAAQQTANAILEGTVLVAQECKLRAEYDLTLLLKIKTSAETSLLNQKLVTEGAQVLATGVDDNSVIGRQKQLYVAQTDGFKRDAEQKAAKLLVDTWSVRRTTDEGTLAGPDPLLPGSADNMLGDVVIGRVVTKLLTGVGA